MSVVVAESTELTQSNDLLYKIFISEMYEGIIIVDHMHCVIMDFYFPILIIL